MELEAIQLETKCKSYSACVQFVHMQSEFNLVQLPHWFSVGKRNNDN